MKIILTGCVGFIGFHLCKRLLLNGEMIVGIDNMNSYYDKKLKEMEGNLVETIAM